MGSMDLGSWVVEPLLDEAPPYLDEERRTRVERYLASGGLHRDLVASRRLGEIARDEVAE